MGMSVFENPLGKRLLAGVGMTVVIIFGGGIFHALEGDEEKAALEAWQLFASDFSASRTEEEMAAINDYAERMSAAPSGSNWDFQSSCWFCLTLVTTIGYGSYAPSTSGAKVFLIFYSLIGLLLTGTFLVWITEAVLYKVAMTRKLMRSSMSNTESGKSTTDMSPGNRVATASMVLLMHLIVCGGLAFHFIEDWSFGDSVYFSYVSLTTIGLGDFAPSTTTGQNYSYFFLLTGLGMITVIFEGVMAMLLERAERRKKEKEDLVKKVTVNTKEDSMEEIMTRAV